MELIKNVAAVVGCLLSCLSLVAIICKPIRKSLASFIAQQSGKSETDRKLDEMQTQILSLKQMMESHLQADAQKQQHAKDDRDALLCLLRNSITAIYYEYLPTKEIPAHQYKNVILLNDAYQHEGGNTYVATIVDDIRDWRVLPE